MSEPSEASGINSISFGDELLNNHLISIKKRLSFYGCSLFLAL